MHEGCLPSIGKKSLLDFLFMLLLQTL